MEFRTSSAQPTTLRTHALVIGIYADDTLSLNADLVDKAMQGFIRSVIQSGDVSGKADACHLLHAHPELPAERIVLIGLGAKDDFDLTAFRRAVAAGVKRVSATPCKDMVLAIPAPDGAGDTETGRAIALAAADALYRFEPFKSKPAKASKLKKLTFLTDATSADDTQRGLDEGHAIAGGSALARDLGNLPANVCTPTYLADEAEKIARKHDMQADILDRKKMAALGMNTLLSVAAGSHQPPKLIVLKHLKGDSHQKPVVLVGKGVTFDTGGISLKPGAEMDEMKYDMCGAASVLGTMRAVGEMNLPINLIAIIPATENMPGGSATRPGDIVTSMSGQTVEILNTDAEGRLILCDALTYAERFDPACVIDIATLTGACVVALGNVATGLLANDEPLAHELLAAGTRSGDRAWQLPLWEDYQDQLKSNFADMANIGGRAGGAITAASFLARFTKKYRWAHLDIAGTAWRSGKDKGSTGRPVPLLCDFILARTGSADTTPAKRARRR
jgi:leucyl aminopeptidase